MAGTTDDYHAPKLVRLPSRGDVWYVVVTKPVSLRKRPNDKQARRSTKTTDFKLAQKRLHGIATEIYREFGTPLKDELEATSGILVGGDMRGTITDKQIYDPVERRRVIGWLLEEASKLEMRPVDEEDGDGEDAYLQRAATQQIKPRLAALLSETYEDGTTQAGKMLSDASHDYLTGRTWDRKGTAREAERHIRRFIEIIGDLPLADLKKQHAYQFAETLDRQGYANKTVTTGLSYVSRMLVWWEQKGLLATNPLSGLKLNNYGKKSEKYRPLDKGMLTQLFSLPMHDQERLMFSILVTTGMRLDEAALLTWENVKEEDGITFFDLRDSIVKNDGSQRMVPVPDCLKLPQRSKGRLFNYELNDDGKTDNGASRKLNRIIDKVIDQKGYVVHSLRGTLKTLLRDAGVPKELNDYITGHSSGDVAGKYGEGHSLGHRLKALNSVDHPWLRIVPAPHTRRKASQAS